MQPTVMRSSKVLDVAGQPVLNDDGSPQLKREALILERREKILVPTVNGASYSLIRIAPMSVHSADSLVVAPESLQAGKTIARRTSETVEQTRTTY